MKKLIAMVLTIAMVLSMVIVAGAADFTDAAEIDVKNTEAVTVLSELGIIAGMGDGTFAPDTILTRAQAAKILACVMLGVDGANALPKGTSTFSDVPADNWASPFVEYCAQQGIVAGIGNGKFGPNNKLTGFAFGKMLLVAAGFNAETEGLVGASWEKNTNELLKDTNLNQGVTVSSAELNREDACHLALNAMFYGEVENPEATLAYKAFGVMRLAGKGEKKNMMRPVTVYISTADGKYWDGTDLAVDASPFYMGKGKLMGSKVYDLVGQQEITDASQITIYRNGVFFSWDSFNTAQYNTCQEGNTNAFDRTGTGINYELYYDASMNMYTLVMYGYRAGRIVEAVAAVTTSDGEVLEPGYIVIESYDTTFTIPANDYTPDDVGNYVMYNGYSTKASWNTLDNATEAIGGTIVEGVLGTADAKTCQIGGKTYSVNRFPAVTGADYLNAGGAEGDTVKALIYDNILYAVWKA